MVLYFEHRTIKDQNKSIKCEKISQQDKSQPTPRKILATQSPPTPALVTVVIQTLLSHTYPQNPHGQRGWSLLFDFSIT